jgi:hypothetical protein
MCRTTQRPVQTLMSPSGALLRLGKIADGLQLLGEERSCTGHLTAMTGFDPKPS